MTIRVHRVATAAIAAARLGVSTHARAAGGADEAAAVALVEEAKRLMSAGDYASACPKMAEAHRLVPTSAKSLRLGDCLEREGRLASAWGAFKQAEIEARAASDAERETEGARRAKALEGTLSKLTIVMPGVPAGVEIRRDGGLVGEGQLGTPVPVDAGEHVVEVTAPKRRKWSVKVHVAPDGANVAVNVPELPLDPDASSTAGGFTWGPQRIAGTAVGGVGLVGIVVGSVFGLKTLSKTNDAKGHCMPTMPPQCDATGVALESGAKTTANVSNVAFALGGAALVTGVVLVVVGAPSQAKSGAQQSLQIGPAVAGGTAGLRLRGAW
jgi:hypothetical protein